jgi:GDP-mannose transporter
MSRSFFAPDGKTPAPPSESANAPFLDGSSEEDRMRLPSHTNETRDDHKQGASVTAMAPILAYCASSIMMTVVNKFVLKAHFSLNLIVLLIQSAVGCSLVVLAQSMKLVELRPLNAKDVKLWMPISTLLVFVIWTGSKALQYLSIPVYTIFKNLTIILIAYGEVIWFGGRVTRMTMASFMLMVLSSLIAAYSDIAHYLAVQNISMPHTPDSLNGGSVDPATHIKAAAYDALGQQKAELAALEQAIGGQDQVFDGLSGAGLLNSGYLWMALNCACSAAYVLVMRKRIKMTGFKDWDTMFYNNLLTVPVLVAMSWLVEDWSSANFERNFPIETRNSIFAAIIFSGACAVFISYTTAWCIRATSSTTYSMVGALNKLPLALSGMIFFGDAVTLSSTSAIGVGFIAGLVYAYAKNKQAEDAKRSAAFGVAKEPAGNRHETNISMNTLANGKEERND